MWFDEESVHMFLRLALGWRHQVGPGLRDETGRRAPAMAPPTRVASRHGARSPAGHVLCVHQRDWREKLLNESASGLGLGRTYGVPPI